MTASLADRTVEPVLTGTFGHSAGESFEWFNRPSWHADALCQEHPGLSWFEIGRSDVPRPRLSVPDALSRMSV
jgi:hypothetical protein